MGLRSGLLAAWANAWLDGRCGTSEVISAVVGDDAPHRVRGLADAGLSDAAGLLDVLTAFRRGGRPRLVLPVPGDVRGLPGPDEFRLAAIEAGEAVVLAGLGFVPEVVRHEPSSAPPTVTWQAYEAGAVPADELYVKQAQYELTEAIRDCATALAAADVGGGSAGVLAGLRDARSAGERLDLPPAFPRLAVALAAQSERLQAVLDLASKDPAGGAVDRFGMSARASGLRPLADAVRRARLAAYNAGGNDASSN